MFRRKLLLNLGHRRPPMTNIPNKFRNEFRPAIFLNRNIRKTVIKTRVFPTHSPVMNFNKFPELITAKNNLLLTPFLNI